MIVRWTQGALRDLESVHSYVAQHSPASAADVVAKIVEGIDMLGRHPELGRRGRVAGSRELVIPPYVVAYRIRKSVVVIEAIIHSARRWPDSL